MKATTTVLLCALAVLALIAMFGCGEESPTTPTPAGGVTIVINNTQTQGGAPSPSPEPGAGGAIASVRVGIFGQDCSSGRVPNNAERLIRVGCTAHLTATPKDANGVDVGAPIHGPDAAWTVSVNPGVLEVTFPGNPFNRDAKGLGSGVAHFSVTVKGVTGELDVTVAP